MMITDVLGNEIMVATHNNLLNKTIDVSSIKSGLYFLQLTFVNKQEPGLIKFVKV